MSEVSVEVSVSQFGERLIGEDYLLDEGKVVVRVEQGEDVVGLSMNVKMALQLASRLVEACKEANEIEKAREARRGDRNE